NADTEFVTQTTSPVTCTSPAFFCVDLRPSSAILVRGILVIRRENGNEPVGVWDIGYDVGQVAHYCYVGAGAVQMTNGLRVEMQTETNRIEAFSDGMFAIAITLLILEIKVPTPEPGQLAGALLRQWPSYLAFLLSFFYIGVMWMNHHRMFTHIRRSNDTLL